MPSQVVGIPGRLGPPYARDVSATIVERRVAELVRRCHAGLDTESLQIEVLRRLRSVLTIDAAFFATVDPATLLFTSALIESPLREVTPQFLANEFGSNDVNKFADLARAPVPARSLDTATGYDRSKSNRYREIMAPLGLGDELRVALRAGSTVWGVLCLHRQDSPLGFSDEEVRLLQHVAPHVAAGLRHSLLLSHAQNHRTLDAAGLLVLDVETLAISSTNIAAESALADLHQSDAEDRADLPFAIQAIARHARDSSWMGDAVVPTVRLRTHAGHWLALHASMLTSLDGTERVAVVIEAAGAESVASLLLDAYELTPREQEVTELVLRGYSTHQIVNELRISSHTVQDHLKSVFGKFGVGSRRELVSALLGSSHR
jgi:DNA-binding CsgD family transcriptional regulator/GAF domain-containing protein